MVDTCKLHGACMGFKSPLGFYIQMVLKIVICCLTRLAFLTGPYSGIVQELADAS